MRYQSNRPKRQFLAGVKCTQCGQIDSTVQIQIFEPSYDEYIQCTLCGHEERRPTIEQTQKIQLENQQDTVGLVKFISQKN